VRILLVSQLYPGPDDHDLGSFVQGLERALAARGHELERAVVDRRAGGKRRFVGLARRTIAASRRFRPDVVYAHFLVPTGLIAALAAPRTPLVVTAHGQDVENVGSIPGVRAATELVARRASRLIAVSDWLRVRLEERVPAARGKTDVVDAGVDLSRFPLLERTDDGAARPAYLCVGSLSERKNVVRLADAFATLGEGTLTFVGEGPLRPQLEGRQNVRLVGAVPQAELPRLLAAADAVCQPSLVEPFGLATLEAMACGRPVVATTVGGPREFVPPGAGVLVDPTDTKAIAAGLRAAAALPCPNEQARAAAAGHDLAVQAARVEAILARAAGL
jgi:glycosyltransferase involved in cell wall biosynthesis